MLDGGPARGVERCFADGELGCERRHVTTLRSAPIDLEERGPRQRPEPRMIKGWPSGRSIDERRCLAEHTPEAGEWHAHEIGSGREFPMELPQCPRHNEGIEEVIDSTHGVREKR